MLLHLLKTRYTQLGGLRLVRQYAKMGLLWPAAKTVLRHPFSKQTYKQVYLERRDTLMVVKETSVTSHPSPLTPLLKWIFALLCAIIVLVIIL